MFMVHVYLIQYSVKMQIHVITENEVPETDRQVHYNVCAVQPTCNGHPSIVTTPAVLANIWTMLSGLV